MQKPIIIKLIRKITKKMFKYNNNKLKLKVNQRKHLKRLIKRQKQMPSETRASKSNIPKMKTRSKLTLKSMKKVLHKKSLKKDQTPSRARRNSLSKNKYLRKQGKNLKTR